MPAGRQKYCFFYQGLDLSRLQHSGASQIMTLSLEITRIWSTTVYNIKHILPINHE